MAITGADRFYPSDHISVDFDPGWKEYGNHKNNEPPQDCLARQEEFQGHEQNQKSINHSSMPVC